MFDDAVIAEATRRLARAAPGADIILFGSHARGEARAQSDLDILVVEANVENPAQESIRLRRQLRGLRLAVDVIVVSRREAEEWRDVRGSFIHTALTEGRVLTA